MTNANIVVTTLNNVKPNRKFWFRFGSRGERGACFKIGDTTNYWFADSVSKKFSAVGSVEVRCADRDVISRRKIIK